MPTIARILLTVGTVLGCFMMVGLAALGMYALCVEPLLLGTKTTWPVIHHAIMPFLLDVLAGYGVVVLAGTAGYGVGAMITTRVRQARRGARYGRSSRSLSDAANGRDRWCPGPRPDC
jgi:hypothetical protein